MGESNAPFYPAFRRAILLLSAAIGFMALLITVQILVAAEEEVVVADLSGSYKSVSQAQAVAGDILQYTILISNSGNTVANVAVTDTLPVSVTFQNLLPPTGSSFIPGGSGHSGGVITMTGLVGGNGWARLDFTAAVTDTVLPGQAITNTVEITGTGSVFTRSAGTLVASQPATTTIYLPISYNPPPKIALQATRPNSSNSWTLSWNDGGAGVTNYELQESQDPAFAVFTTYVLTSPATSQAINHLASFTNEYYYRVRALAGPYGGNWSNVVTVVGAYYDDFSNDTSGWSVRRMSFLEQTFGFYGSGAEAGNYILIVDDRWDWMLASPFKPAPQIPYVIEYRSRNHHLANLVSGGAVFGGDWNGQPCPEIGNVYETNNCFNHFYNMNTIWFGGLKVLFERVDYLVFCPACMGSPLKRLTDDQNVWRNVTLDNVNPNSWNTWRVEVRSTGINFYANGKLQMHSSDTRWINEPYFGVFASTDEYKPSIWFFDYFKVTPLDS